MPLDDSALAVAYYKVKDGRVVLLHTEVPHELSGLGFGSRLAHGVFRSVATGRVIAKCPSCLPTRPGATSTERSSMADRGPTGRARTTLLTMIPSAYRMHVQREFLISSAASDSEVHWAGRAHEVASTRIKTIAPSRAGSKGDHYEITEDCRLGCHGFAGHGRRGCARADQRSGLAGPTANAPGRLSSG
ncbi:MULTISPECIES: N-acetyltransferase [unclassified Bradyrhizobium]|uniref:N-acetyltransferase n=1 Tax=unclassified Bradyrhizobium TaxID=2631580 RepID=UPI002478880F|nr:MULTISPECIES: N-acetyltransferase [unclassified Bradyrhizobium]WGS19976.1 N-acetyltransferase [Bradyrhizobium sp. ISRA463]WGS26833.1 N-acetyltransferase [Bradyrhizobium sp. ISRA464]